MKEQTEYIKDRLEHGGFSTDDAEWMLAEIERLRTVLREARKETGNFYKMGVMERCQKYGQQWCSECPSHTCNDNTSPLAMSLKKEQARAEQAEHLHAECLKLLDEETGGEEANRV